MFIALYYRTGCFNNSGNSKRDINRIIVIIKKSGSIIQSNEQSDFSVYYKNAIQRKRQAILKDQNHALHPEFHKHVIARSGGMRIPACSTNRYLKSFIPQAISLFNSVITR